MRRPWRIIAIWRKYSFNKYISSILFALLTSIALARAFQQFYFVDAAKVHQYSLWWHIPFNLFIWWLWMLFVPLVYWTMVTLREKTGNPWSGFIVYLLLPGLFILVRQTIAAAVVYIIIGQSTFLHTLGSRTLRAPIIWIDFVVYYSIMIGVRIVEYQQKRETDKVKIVQLQARLTQSQLNALRSQLRPHFLFNALNSVSTSIFLKENTDAKRMLALISNFLKTTVTENNQQEISLQQELSFINRYLQIEKVRFEEKLTVVRDLAPETLTASVPSFLLLPLVENTIYHAIVPNIHGGTIRLASKKEGDVLTIIVEDTGPGTNETARKKKSGEGIGIKITKERLEHRYGTNQSLQFEHGTMGGLKATIRIPFKQQESLQRVKPSGPRASNEFNRSSRLQRT
ncbi:MAG: hypothetical protein EHM64_02850 [Ignavibacteriae bacterium]|nr:MAG: hypothetical protein EHM64_02850 [Ignavibacteriota bacterium]